MLRDVRFGIRMLFRRPGFSWIVVLTLALGIGATSAVFSLIEGVLLTPPPYREPDRLVLVSPARTDGDQTLRALDWAAAQWLEWQDEARSFEAIAAYLWTFNFWVSEEGSESLQGMLVSQDYFEAIGLEPAIGRTFTDADTQAGAAPVIILGYNLWRRRFAGDPDVLGQTVRLSRRDTPQLVALGVIAGVAAAAALSRVLESFLFEIESTDPLTMVAASLTAPGCYRCNGSGRSRA